MKKPFYKAIILIVAICMVSFIFTSCNDNPYIKQEAGSRTSESTSDDLTTEKMNIQYAQWSVPFTELMEEKINRFNDTNKENIHVNVLNIPLDRYVETLNMLNASGNGPDVFEILHGWLNSYIIKGWLADLSPFADKTFFKGFPEEAIDLSRKTIDGKFYSIPSNQITYRLIYNKDLFRNAGLNPDNPPKTLMELEKYAKLISDTERGKRKYGMAMPLGELWMDFVQPMEALSCYSGMYFYDYQKATYDLTVYEPWLKAFKDLNENGGMFPGMDTMKSNQAMAQFAEGNVGMMYAASWQVSLLLNQFTMKCDWGVSLPPAIDEASIGKGKIKIDTAGWNVIRSDAKHMEEAVSVWKFLYSQEFLGDLFENKCMIPVTSHGMSGAKTEKKGADFDAFFPGKNDSIYPNTPMQMEEWTRKNLYLSTLTINQKGKILLEESNRLNTLLNTAITAKTMNISDYYYPDFTFQSPMKE